MKAVILVRHAKASPKDLPIPDKERPLRERGKKDLKRMRNALVRQSIKPQYIFTSTANRASQTATILASFYEMCDSISFHDELYHPDAEEIVDFVRRSDDAFNKIMVVGHNPELAEAADLLLKGNLQDPVPTSACMCISFDVDAWGRIKENTGKLEYYEYPKKHKQEV